MVASGGAWLSNYANAPCSDCTYHFYKAMRFVFPQMDGSPGQKKLASTLGTCTNGSVIWKGGLTAVRKYL